MSTKVSIRRPVDETDFREMMRNRLVQYLQRRNEVGHDTAFEELLVGYPELQRELIGPRISECSLFEGFTPGTVAFAKIGLLDEFVDISTEDIDAVIEMLVTCICENAMKDIGMTEPCSVLCALDQEASRRAFPELDIQQLKRKVDGAHLCVFRWQRAQLLISAEGSKR